MGVYSWKVGAIWVAGLLASEPAHAQRSNCGGPPCNTQGSIKGSSVIPDSNDFNTKGDLFTSAFRDYDLRNGAQEISFGFNVNFGFGLVGSAFLNKNGAISFGAPIAAAPSAMSLSALGAAATVPNGGLESLGVPVIAPYYAELDQGLSAGDTRLTAGDITVQYGLADPYPDANGRYDPNEARQAVRITWYGLTQGAAPSTLAAATAQQYVYAQLLISADSEGLSNFEFRYGPPGQPGQADYGSIAGFALGNTILEFNGPYVQGVPTFFEFNNGNYIGQGGRAINPAVPEPATWAQLILGFGAVGYALRRRRVRLALPAG